MKKISYLLILPILVFSIIGVVGCSNDDEQYPFNMDTEKTFYPNNDINNEVRGFFESKLNSNEAFFLDVFQGMLDIDTCFVVNSMEEFCSLCPNVSDYPSIDFATNTFIVGKFVRTAGFLVKEHNVILTDGKLVLRIYISSDGYEAHTCIMKDYYYWGVYRKLPSSSIQVKLIEE